MSNKSVYFTDFSTVKDREHFDLDAEISPETFEHLVGAYRFTQEVICQVRFPARREEKRIIAAYSGVIRNRRFRFVS